MHTIYPLPIRMGKSIGMILTARSVSRVARDVRVTGPYEAAHRRRFVTASSVTVLRVGSQE